jgi:hypothetical protein
MQNKVAISHNLTIELLEAPTMLIDGQQFILTGVFLIVGTHDGQFVVMDEATKEQFILSK